ncbi:MAG: TonB-dependent receptor [Acidobacteria bacterium]|nr:TonB-dependent receptor [Acidobacteriota bacterium]
MKNPAVHIIKRAASLAAIAVIFAFAAFGQSNTGSITGVITDQNGAIVPNATVTVTNQGTNEKRTVQADNAGRYEAPSLSTGVYSIEASASGFQATTVKDLRLAVGEKARADVALSVSGVAVTVDVVNQTRVDTESPTIGDTIATARIQDNPVNGRDFTQLLATVPGSVQTTNQFQTSINGIPSTFGGSSVLVDGIDAGRVDLNGTSNVLGRVESRVNRVSMDSIQEVQVLEQNYSAQYGDAIGAVINPITKSGTNNLHGSVFEFFRNEALDSEDYFAGKQKFRLNQFGGNLSGPIIKDKLFFFTNYEGVRQDRGIQFNSLVPTAVFRSEFVPGIAPVLATMPLPNAAEPDPDVSDPDNDGVDELGRFIGQRVAELTENTGSVKIDWLHTDKSHFSFRYNINDSNTDTPYGVASDQIAPAKLRVQLFKASHNYVFSPTSVNEFAFGINHNYTDVTAGPSTLPRFDLSFVNPFYAVPGPAQFDQERTGIVYHFLDTFSIVSGDHSLKAGVDIRLNRRSAESRQQETVQFFGLQDFANNAPFVLSRQGHPKLDYANENFGLFVQDDWKAHPRLTLNLGLRYDVSTVSREEEGRLQNFDLVTKTFSPLGEKVYNIDKNNFGPRLGFAFDVFGTQKTVLRGGYGIFYNRELPASWGSPQANTYPSQSVDVFQWLGGVFGGTCDGGSTFQYPIDPRVFNCGVNAAFAIERDLNTTMAQHWSLNVQQDVGFGVLTVGYVGNHVTHILTDGVVSPRNVNRRDPVFGVRPDPNFGDIFVVGGYPSSSYNGMQVNFRRNLSKGLRFNANYTWSHAIDNIAGFFKDYQNENDINADRASADSDVRHNFTFDAGYELRFRNWFGDGPGWLIDGWNVNTIAQVRSGLPVNPTVQGGIFGGFSFRPNLVPNVDVRCPNYSLPTCQFNAAAFTIPPAGQFGNAGRNILRGPGFSQIDLSFGKNTRITENTSLQLRLEIFNIFDRANFADPSGGLSCGGAVGVCGNFGESLSTVGNQLGGLLGFGGPRQMQLSARFNF